MRSTRPVCRGPEGVGYLLKERVGRVEQLLDAVERVRAGECVVDRAEGSPYIPIAWYPAST